MLQNLTRNIITDKGTGECRYLRLRRPIDEFNFTYKHELANYLLDTVCRTVDIFVFILSGISN